MDTLSANARAVLMHGVAGLDSACRGWLEKGGQLCRGRSRAGNMFMLLFMHLKAKINELDERTRTS